MRKCCVVVGLFFLLLSCAPGFKIQRELARNEIQFKDHIGLMVYDPQSGKTLVDFNSNKYFTPASNTKIFTLFSCLQLLGDSIPAIKYIEKDDSLIIWGTGDPSFLYSEVDQNSRTYDFLNNHPSSIYLSLANYHDDYFGPGWAWDDYNSAYSAERSAFPIYGNCMTLTDSVDNEIRISPNFFLDSLTTIQSLGSGKKAVRPLNNNQIQFTSDTTTKSYTKTIPFHITTPLIGALLSDTLKRKVEVVNMPLPPEAGILYSTPVDSLYKVMMQESDNFIAEQLLQMCAMMISDSLNSQIAIDYVKENFLSDLPDEPQWVDGSGLSRYNLFTPRSIVKLWSKMLDKASRERLFQILAIGGKAGTISNSYKVDPPYIYGKTGTLSNNHCISGYLLTKKGRMLIFSFMNNNFTLPTREVRANMERVLYKIHEKN